MADGPQLLFVQGGGEGTHDEWDDKLVSSLLQELGRGFEIRYPRMPDEHEPNYEQWKSALQGELETLREGAILVGHSLGATILLNMLAEQRPPRQLGGLFLIAAPFVGEGGWPSDDVQLPPDLAERLPTGMPIHFYHGTEDEVAPPSHLALYARAVPLARVHRLPGRDHQLNNDLRELAADIKALEKPR